ncbi:MAG: protein phosphatase 2C domain-containing protein [Isosphaeraceae bacterium]|nr:protein phosphatase 2C domain-containing protein [Isosphaeraceae bacterium]
MDRDENRDLEDTAYQVQVDPGVAWYFELEPRIRARVEAAGRSHPGKVRPNNEDNFLAVRRYRGREILATSLPLDLLQTTDDHAYVFAVADGMGGRKFGEIASLLTMRTGFELGGSEIKWSMKMNEREATELRQKAETFFGLINEALRAEIRESPALAGMGTTLTVAYSTGPELFVIHAGDSRAYLYRDGVVKRLTRDHNLSQVLVDAGVAEPGSPEAQRVRHVLTSFLGGPDESLTIDVYHERLADCDRLLLCTDGLSDMVDDAEIARVLASYPASDTACQTLIERALDHGGADNVTVLVAGYHFDDQQPRRTGRHDD